MISLVMRVCCCFTGSPCPLSSTALGLLDNVWWMCWQLVSRNDPSLGILNSFHLFWRALGLSGWMYIELKASRLADLLECGSPPHIRSPWKNPKGWSCAVGLSWHPVHAGEVDHLLPASLGIDALFCLAQQLFSGLKACEWRGGRQSQRVNDSISGCC